MNPVHPNVDIESAVTNVPWISYGNVCGLLLIMVWDPPNVSYSIMREEGNGNSLSRAGERECDGMDLNKVHSCMLAGNSHMIRK